MINNNKISIQVPPGIRYINEWSGFSLNQFNGAYIIDKQIPGCGFTEYCLTNNQNIILCSPRRILLENKEDQHKGEVFYVKNEHESELGVDENLLKDSPGEKKKDIIHKILIDKEAIARDLMNYCYSRSIQRKPIKVIVTYDSFKYVREIFETQGIMKAFTIIVDEFQSIFVDSKFKADTEFSFLTYLQGLLNSVCFVSATPMLSEYLQELDEFKYLPYYELDWETLDPGRVMHPALKVRTTQSIISEVKRIINEYKNGEYQVLANPITGDLVESKEAVFYVNSVNTILTLIKQLELRPDEVNILCSRTDQNKAKLKNKLRELKPFIYEIGSVPLRGEPHKMFTFCTRTVYLGADFYSTCARTFVLSDANIDSLAVDISLDLPQILGRQRLLENPWKNHAEFYFKTLGKNKITLEIEFNAKLKEKLESTERLLDLYYNKADTEESKKDLLRKYDSDIAVKKYRNDYVSINSKDGINYPVNNKLVYIAEKRAFDIQQIDYKDRFTVFNIINRSDSVNVDSISNMIAYLQNTNIKFSVRLKTLCESEFTDQEKSSIARQASESFDKFYNILGPSDCRRFGYNITLMESEVKNKIITKDIDVIKESFLRSFKVGDRKTKSDFKQDIQNIYNELGISKNAKASDLNDYFELKEVKITIPGVKKQENGFKILGLK